MNYNFKLLTLILILTAFLSVCLSLRATDKKGGKTSQLIRTKDVIDNQGAIIRRNPEEKKVFLVFTADEFAEGRDTILKTLNNQKIKGSFFLTGNFYRNQENHPFIRKAKKEGHYLGAHSDKHLLYCDWVKRDSLLVTRKEFEADLLNNYAEMRKFGIPLRKARYYIPPYEWYNSDITKWASSLGIQLTNLTPGTATNADYTTPDMANYQSTDAILKKIIKFESNQPNGLNGCIMLVHLGTDPSRTDKLYYKLNYIIELLKEKGYTFGRF